MDPFFKVIVLGCSGGPRENNLSGYLCAPLHAAEFVALDGGSLLHGIDQALAKGSFNDLDLKDPEWTPAGKLLRQHIKAYLISHPHLDHIAGLVINSQKDAPKVLAGMDFTIDCMRDHIFNERIWPNFGNEGFEPKAYYTYQRLQEGIEEKLQGTGWKIQSFFLSHSPNCPSSAFILSYQGHHLLYCGDTASDEIAKGGRLETIWKQVAPLIKEKTLHGIFLECSYSSLKKDKVGGHLHPQLLYQELKHLESIAGLLKGLPVVITHRKESLRKEMDSLQQIKKEILELPALGIRWIFPSQGEKILF